MALDIHGHRILRDVGGGDLDMDRKAGGAAAEALGTDAELVYRARQLLFDSGALLVGADGSKWPRRGNLRQMHAEVRGAANADADDGRRTNPAARLDHPVDYKTLHRIDAVGRQQHLQERAVLRTRSLRDH